MGSTLEEAARRCGTSKATFLKQVKRGVIPRELDGSYDLRKVMPAWKRLKARRREEEGEQAEQQQQGQFGRVRLQREALRAALLNLELQKRKGTLVSAEEVKAAAFTEARRFRDAVLAVPDRVSAVLAGMSAEEIHRALTEELTRALRELSGYKGEEAQ